MSSKLELLTNCSIFHLIISLQIIFRTLLVWVLLPLLALYPVFSSLHQANSPTENLSIFALLAICNCFCYLSRLSKEIFQ